MDIHAGNLLGDMSPIYFSGVDDYVFKYGCFKVSLNTL